MQKKEYEDDVLMLGGHPFHSRFILGSGKFSLSLIQTVMEYGGSEIATIALRRANADSKENILDFLPKNITLLPNTSGARNAEEAIRIARLSRELGCGDFVKVEIIHETKYLLPDNEETIRATRQLAKEGFIVLPYMYPDLVAARKLEDAGAAAIMPLGAPIGSNQGLRTKDFIRILIDEMKLPIIVDAGIGAPSQKPWKWGLLRLWQILPLQLPEIVPQWQRLSALPLKRDGWHICRSWAEFWIKVQKHPAH